MIKFTILLRRQPSHPCEFVLSTERVLIDECMAPANREARS